MCFGHVITLWFIYNKLIFSFIVKLTVMYAIYALIVQKDKQQSEFLRVEARLGLTTEGTKVVVHNVYFHRRHVILVTFLLLSTVGFLCTICLFLRHGELKSLLDVVISHS